MRLTNRLSDRQRVGPKCWEPLRLSRSTWGGNEDGPIKDAIGVLGISIDDLDGGERWRDVTNTWGH